MNPNRKNLANAFLANPITDTATTMVYQTGYGSGKPAVPYFDTLTPAGQLSTMGNSEIVQVTALSGDTATIVRARKGTTAKAFPAGTIASNGIYVEDKVGSENIDWATFNGTFLPDYSIENVITGIPSGAVTDHLLYTAAVDSYLSYTAYGMPAGEYYSRIGLSPSAGDNRVVISGNTTGRIGFLVPVPKGAKVYITRGSVGGGQSASWWPIKKA